jgi:hypothetical protein
VDEYGNDVCFIFRLSSERRNYEAQPWEILADPSPLV